MLLGNTIQLRPLENQDLTTIAQWRNQEQIRKSFFSMSLLSSSKQEKWFQQYLDDTSKEFFIAESNENNPIGMIGLCNIDHKNHNAELGLRLVGDLSSWGKGLGTEMTHLTLDYGFEDLMLNRIYGYVLSSNPGALHVNKKCGFKVEGIMRESYFMGDSFQDVTLVGITRKDWQELKSNK